MTSRGDTRAPPLYRFFRGLITDERGQAEAIGVVLLIGITVIGTVGIVTLGSGMISDTEQYVDSETASHTMGQMSSQGSEVALGESESQSVELPRGAGAGQSQVVDDGWIEMRIVNESDHEVEATVFNESLGAVVYENGDEQIAYQGGGVWKKSANDSDMVSPPEFHYRDDTLTVPVIQVHGDDHLTGDATLRKNGTTEQLYPNEAEGYSNPFSGTNQTIQVTVNSEYYEAWGDFFDTRTDGQADVDHDEQTASLTLVADREEHSVEGAVGSTSANGDLAIAGNDARTDSYDSQNGTYEETKSYNGTIVAAGDIEMAGSAKVHGDVFTGSDFEIGGNAVVNGSVTYTGAKERQGNSHDITGSTYSPADIASSGAIDPRVESQINETRNGNNNESVDVVQDGHLDFNQGDTELVSGDYYLEQLSVPDGETLTIDTTDGTVRIGVEEYVEIGRGSEIAVEGDNRVELYLGAEETTGGNHFEIDGGQVNVPEDNSTQFWVYSKEHFNAEFDSHGNDDAVFQGAIYAPTAIDGDGGQVDVRDATVFGGIMAGSTEIHNNGNIHFDQALEEEQAIPEDTTVVIVNYVHATLNQVDIED